MLLAHLLTATLDLNTIHNLSKSAILNYTSKKN